MNEDDSYSIESTLGTVDNQVTMLNKPSTSKITNTSAISQKVKISLPASKDDSSRLEDILRSIHSSKEYFVTIYPHVEESSLINDRTKFKVLTTKNRRSQLRLFLKKNSKEESAMNKLTQVVKDILTWMETLIFRSLTPSNAYIQLKINDSGIRDTIEGENKIFCLPTYITPLLILFV